MTKHGSKCITAAAGSAALVAMLLSQPERAQAANPLIQQADHVAVMNDHALDAVRGSGYTTDYYGYYGNLFAYYAYIYSYYGRYYYTSGGSESTNAYRTAANYSLQAYYYNYYASYFGQYGY